MHEVTLTPAHTEDVVTLMDEQGQQIASDLSGAPDDCDSHGLFHSTRMEASIFPTVIFIFICTA